MTIRTSDDDNFDADESIFQMAKQWKPLLLKKLKK